MPWLKAQKLFVANWRNKNGTYMPYPAVAWVSTQLFYIIKTMTCNSTKLSLLMERVGERRIKSTSYIPLIPAFSLKGEGASICVDTYEGMFSDR
jgi:hypothetical protein